MGRILLETLPYFYIYMTVGFTNCLLATQVGKGQLAPFTLSSLVKECGFESYPHSSFINQKE